MYLNLLQELTSKTLLSSPSLLAFIPITMFCGLSCASAVKRVNRTNSYSYLSLLCNGAKSEDRPPVVSAWIDAVFVGDRSGSMATMGVAPQDGVAEFIQQYRELAISNPRSSIYVSVVTFDSQEDVVFSGNARRIADGDVARARDGMVPRGTTRLFDTAVNAIVAQQARVDKRRLALPREVAALNPISSVSLTLLTDGQDNESILYHARDLNREIRKHREDYGAACLFAAANQDAMSAGAAYGFSASNSLQIGDNVEEAKGAFRSCAAAAVRSATQDSCSYTKAEREASCANVGGLSSGSEYNTGSEYSSADEDFGANDGNEYQAMREPCGGPLSPPPFAQRC